jgi:hypothetical protein
MSDSAFSKYTDETLLTTRKNLLRGLEKVSSTIEAGSFHTVGPKGAAPPSQSGQLTVALLLAVQEELGSRGYDLTW